MKSYPYAGRQKLLQELIKSFIICFFTNRVVFSRLTYPLLRMIYLYNRQARFEIFKGKEITSITREALDSLKEKINNTQAGVGIENLKHIDSIIDRCLVKARMLDSALKSMGVVFQESPPGAVNAYFKYVIRVPSRDDVLSRLFECGIDVTYGYMRSCSDIDDFKRYSAGCPESVRLDREHIYLPIHSLLRDTDVGFLVGALKGSLESASC